MHLLDSEGELVGVVDGARTVELLQLALAADARLEGDVQAGRPDPHVDAGREVRADHEQRPERHEYPIGGPELARPYAAPDAQELAALLQGN